MKKIIFGSASAILAVIGFSAFKSAKTSTTTYYWFQLAAGDTQLGVNEVLNNSDGLTFLQRSTTLPTSVGTCDHNAISQCVVGFTANQIFTTSGETKVLKTHGVDPSVGAASQTSKTAPTGPAYVRS